jgi:fructokinase
LVCFCLCSVYLTEKNTTMNKTFDIPPIIINQCQPCDSNSYLLGIDLGGTKIEGIALDSQGSEILRYRIPTEQEMGYRHILDNICLVYRNLTDAIGNQPHRFGIGTPGALSKKSGLLKNSNTQCLNGKPLRADLESMLHCRVVIENDANCFALAEALMGAAKGKNLVFGIIMGTGCGGGIVYKGDLISGPQSITGEWGHHSIDKNGPLCWCGSRGCVERLISGGGLEVLWAGQHTPPRTLPSIVGEYRAGNADAVTFMNTFFDNFGRAVANIINILDPDMIVLGGGVSTIDELYTTGIEHVRRHVFSDSFETPIAKHTLGDSAGVLGAALVGRLRDAGEMINQEAN